MNIHSEINNYTIKTAFWKDAEVQLNGCKQLSLDDQICLVFNFFFMLQACFALIFLGS